ncbi:hypothetical protein PG994_014460 [Apiospora phragmitis]|uniref:MYND-type domain-containing protein n=1 Tax=Apiospora phragmitis TaxID=2905665 RepID=A0ABR1T4D8_9PEZI
MAHNHPAYDGPRGPLQHRCAACDACDAVRQSPALRRCTGCRLVRYCSGEHQVAHRPRHKQLCKRMSKLRAKLAQEAHAVRHATEDFMTPANAFATHVGRFWGILNTRDYMRARFAVADEARLACTPDGVAEALDHFLDMLRLCRSDNMGVRDHVPALMLRLDRDQEVYDFVKWWETSGQNDDFDWDDDNLAPAFLDFEDEDVLEDPQFMVREYFGNLGFLAPCCCSRRSCSSTSVARKVVAVRLPVELWREVEKNAVRSPLSLKKFVGRPYNDLLQTESKLMAHCGALGRAVNAVNEVFMHELIDLREETLSYRPGAYSHGSYEHMVLALFEVYPAWFETEEVLRLLRNAHRCSLREECDFLLGRQQQQPHHGGSLMMDKGKGKGKDVKKTGFDGVWDFLGLVVSDSPYLGPPEERSWQREGWEDSLGDLMKGNSFDLDVYDDAAQKLENYLTGGRGYME